MLISLKTYVYLGLADIEEPKAVAQTATGNTIEFRASRAIVEINSRRILCRAYSTLGVRRPLLGREVLKHLGLVYDPPERLELGLQRAH